MAAAIAATQAPAEAAKLLKAAEHWTVRLAHAMGLTEEEHYRGWAALGPLLAAAANNVIQWNEDFAARWNGSPVLNTIHMNGNPLPWFYGGFLVDGSHDPRAPGINAPSGEKVFQVNDTGSPIAHAKAMIDRYWTAIAEGKTREEAVAEAEETNSWQIPGP